MSYLALPGFTGPDHLTGWALLDHFLQINERIFNFLNNVMCNIVIMNILPHSTSYVTFTDSGPNGNIPLYK